MTQFYDVDGGFSDMTEEQLDAKALTGRPLCSIGYGYATRGSVEPRFGYTAKWIATGGMGNCGRFILCGLTPEKRELVRVGKTQAIMEDYGIDFATADTIVSVGHLEPKVVEFALSELNNPAWDHFDGNSRWKWVAEFRVDVPSGMSAPRLSKVAEIIQRFRSTVLA